MPAFRCRRCGRGFYSAARLDRVAGGDRCGDCGGRLVEVGAREDRRVADALYPRDRRDVQAAPVRPPIGKGRP